jgi:hypothetical protein
MNTATQDTKQFVTTARDFLLDLVTQRRRAKVKDERQVHRSASLQACGIIEAQLVNYQYTNKTLAQFIIAHFNTIQLIVPGNGDISHSKLTLELMKIYNQALIITTDPILKKFNYYLISNEYGQSYVKTSIGECAIAKLSYEGKGEFSQYDRPYKKFQGDTAVEITSVEYQDGVRKVLAHLRREMDI